MKDETVSRTESAKKSLASNHLQTDDLSGSKLVRRRSFIKGLGIVGATLLPTAGALLKAQGANSSGNLSQGDADLLRFALWAEIVESDLWTQYNELGGATAPNDGAPNPGNPPYIAALQNLDGDMPQYITDNNDDELSHAAFLDAFLRANGAESVNLDPFRILQGSTATGVDKTKIGKRLTNLLSLNVDLSWYTRYRSGENPDLGATINGPFTISKQPAIPLNDTDTPPTVVVPTPPLPNSAAVQRIQAIANTAGFHFAFIEQGGTSLYPTLALKASSEVVLRILLSIGGVEIDHFSLWHDKAGNAVNAPLAGVTDPETKLNFPNLNDPAKLGLQLELTQTNKIQPEPCDFLQGENLPPCSIIRPTSTKLGGAVATVNSFKADGLFDGQGDGFFHLAFRLAHAADNARRQ
jgi:Ferritin-like domain